MLERCVTTPPLWCQIVKQRVYRIRQPPRGLATDPNIHTHFDTKHNEVPELRHNRCLQEIGFELFAKSLKL